MAFEPTLPDLIRAGTGMLWFGLGVALARRGPRLLAVGLLCLGVAVVPDNAIEMFVAAESPPAWTIATELVNALFSVAAALAFLGHLRASEASGRWIGLVLAVTTIGAPLYAWTETVVPVGADLMANAARAAATVQAAAFAAAVVTLGATAHLAARKAREDTTGRSGWLAVGLATYPAVWTAGVADVGNSAALAHVPSLVAALAGIAFVAATVFELGRTPRARAQMLVLLLLGLGAAAARLLSEADLGDRGIGRVISFAIIAYALRDALASGRGDPGGRRGALAAGALAALFIVAQVAQNFLSAQYGLLMGGVVAGALLVAARPIERALEGRGARSAPVIATDERAALYRDLGRRLLSDGVLSREDERRLATLAHQLGMHPDEALRIRHEVEDELRPRAP